jgi:hypothetical protein
MAVLKASNLIHPMAYAKDAALDTSSRDIEKQAHSRSKSRSNFSEPAVAYHVDDSFSADIVEAVLNDSYLGRLSPEALEKAAWCSLFSFLGTGLVLLFAGVCWVLAGIGSSERSRL